MSDDEEKEREQNLRKLWCFVKDMYEKLPKHTLRQKYERRSLLHFLNDIEKESLKITYERFDKYWEQRLKNE